MRTRTYITAAFLAAALLLVALTCLLQPASAQGLAYDSGRTSETSHMAHGPKVHGTLDATGFVIAPYICVVLPLTVGLFRLCVNRVKKARTEALIMVLDYAPFRAARLHVRTSLCESLSTFLLWSIITGSPLALLLK